MSDIESNGTETIDVDRESLRSTNIKDFTNWEIYILKKIDRYFRKSGNQYVETMINIINKTSKISLRMLDWFVAKYAKKKANKKKIIYKLNGEYFSIKISYKAQLETYTKKYFDPFRRRKKFNYHFDPADPDKVLYTTIGQLNFFMWIFQKKIIDYIDDNYDTLAMSMKQSNREEKKKKDTKKEEPVVKKEKIKPPRVIPKNTLLVFD